MKKPCNMRTVLVVDDDPDELAVTCRVLGTRYPVLSARSGEDALRLVHNAHPSIVVLDVMMAGGKDGFSVFHELQLDPATRDIPVLFLTNVNGVTGLPFSPVEVGTYLGREPAGFLEKPVSAEVLLSYTALALNASTGRRKDAHRVQEAVDMSYISGGAQRLKWPSRLDERYRYSRIWRD